MEDLNTEVQSPQEANVAGNTTPQNQPKKRKKWLLPLIIGIAVLLVAGGLLLYHFMFSKSDPVPFDTSLIPVYDGEHWGYVDQKGNYVIKSQFESASWFYEDLARVSDKDGKYGYIDKKGNFAIKAQYSQASLFHEGLAFTVQENSYPVCIDKQGKKVFELRNANQVMNFKEELAAYSSNDSNNPNTIKWGFIDKTGKTVIAPQFLHVSSFSEDMAAVCKEGEDKNLWGFINKKGEFVIEAEFNNALPFSEGLAAVNAGGKWGFIDKEGKYVINPQYDMVYPFTNGKAAFLEDGNWGFINAKGEVVINPQFDRITPFRFGEDAAPFCLNELYGFVDGKGNYVINPTYEDASVFFDGIALVCKDEKWGIIDKKGKYTVEPKFKDVQLPLMDDESIYSEYYDASQFLNTFLKNWDASHVDGLPTNSPTLKDITLQNTYKGIWEKNASYGNILRLTLNDEVAAGITSTDVTFSFNNSIKDYNDTYSYTARCGQATYQLKLTDYAASHHIRIANELCNKLKDIYGGSVSSLTINENWIPIDFCKKISCGNVDFIVIVMDNGYNNYTFMLHAFFDNDLLRNWINYNTTSTECDESVQTQLHESQAETRTSHSNYPRQIQRNEETVDAAVEVRNVIAEGSKAAKGRGK